MMRLPKFTYRTPRTIAEAVKIIGDTGPESQFVAGGTDLYPNMKRRQQMPKTVISVMRLPELNQITGDGASGLVIGASVILSDIVDNPIIERDYPVIASAAPTNGWRASYQKLRRRGACDFPVLGVAAYVRYDKDSNGALPHGRASDTIADAKIVLGGIAPSPIQVNEAAQALIGQTLNEDQIQ